MGVIRAIMRAVNMLFEKDTMEQFGVEDIISQEMRLLIGGCGMIYRGNPPWVDKKADIRTINLAKVVSSETARLTTLAIGLQFNNNPRGQWLQSQFDDMYFRLRHWIEYGNAYGTIVLKPTGDGIDLFLPEQFIVTSSNTKGEIDGIVFRDSYQDGSFYYTRLEYHRFVDHLYVITNKAFCSTSGHDKGKPIRLDKTKWKGLMEEAAIEHVERPLFGVYRTPEANNIDLDSPLGMPQFKEAIEEMKDLDIAYSRNAGEIYDSERISLVDDRLMEKPGQNLKQAARIRISLPRFVKNVFGASPDTFYQEINPALTTEKRILGINQQLDFIGFKCGYSPGYFNFDGRTGMVTATQVEADNQRTIQLIKDHRDKLEDCLDGLIYALNVFADLYNLAPVGNYEVTYSFGDITYSYEEDKLSWWKYRIQGDVPPWMYYVKFEGLSEDEAKKMIEEATPAEGFQWGEE